MSENIKLSSIINFTDEEFEEKQSSKKFKDGKAQKIKKKFLINNKIIP